jgi:hypothetical protein
MMRFMALALGLSLAACGGSGGGTGGGGVPTGGTPTPAPLDPNVGSGIFFDDFNYTSDGDPSLAARRWTVRSGGGGPGVPGATWCCISFMDDPGQAGNRLLQLQASTDGTGAGTRQAEMSQARKFYEGTYVARVLFTDTPSSGGPDGDALVQTFFTITPLAFALDPNYGEIDFEYLPNGGWGTSGPHLFMTTWETYRAEPWLADNTSDSAPASFAGWHDLLFQVSGGTANGTVSYYVDGLLRAVHPAKYYPETAVSVDFNLWFISGELASGATSRTYVQQVDYFYYAGREVIEQAAANARVAQYRAAGTAFVDTVP